MPKQSQEEKKEGLKKMFEDIHWTALNILMLAATAQREENEKERDAMVDLIVSRSADIERTITDNWN